jgi:hypothetical protein
MKQQVLRLHTDMAEHTLGEAVKEGWRVAHLVPFGPSNNLMIVVLEKKDGEELP